MWAHSAPEGCLRASVEGPLPPYPRSPQTAHNKTIPRNTQWYTRGNDEMNNAVKQGRAASSLSSKCTPQGYTIKSPKVDIRPCQVQVTPHPELYSANPHKYALPSTPWRAGSYWHFSNSMGLEKGLKSGCQGFEKAVRRERAREDG